MAASIYVDANDFAGVARAAADLQADIARVAGVTPTITHNGEHPENCNHHRHRWEEPDH